MTSADIQPGRNGATSAPEIAAQAPVKPQQLGFGRRLINGLKARLGQAWEQANFSPSEAEMQAKLLKQRKDTFAEVERWMDNDPITYGARLKDAVIKVTAITNQLYGSDMSGQSEINWLEQARSLHHQADNERYASRSNIVFRSFDKARRALFPAHFADLRDALLQRGIHQAIVLLEAQSALHDMRPSDLFKQGIDGVLLGHGNPTSLQDLDTIPARHNGRDIREDLTHVIGMFKGHENATLAGQLRENRSPFTLDELAEPLPLALLITATRRDNYDQMMLPVVFALEDAKKPYWQDYQPGGLNPKAVSR